MRKQRASVAAKIQEKMDYAQDAAAAVNAANVEKYKMVKVSVDKETCIGCGACVAICSNFDMGDDGKAYPIKKEIDDNISSNKDAEETCPVDAIKVEE